MLKFLKENPYATVKTLEEEIGKSERTVKRLTSSLRKKQLLVRQNGKRSGIWVVP